jgi:hypothetical protein
MINNAYEDCDCSITPPEIISGSGFADDYREFKLWWNIGSQRCSGTLDGDPTLDFYVDNTGQLPINVGINENDYVLVAPKTRYDIALDSASYKVNTYGDAHEIDIDPNSSVAIVKISGACALDTIGELSEKYYTYGHFSKSGILASGSHPLRASSHGLCTGIGGPAYHVSGVNSPTNLYSSLQSITGYNNFDIDNSYINGSGNYGPVINNTIFEAFTTTGNPVFGGYWRGFNIESGKAYYNDLGLMTGYSRYTNAQDMQISMYKVDHTITISKE